MNERTRELFAQATTFAFLYMQPLESAQSFRERQFGKFTELVVAECINQIRKRKEIAIENDWKVDESMTIVEVDIEDWFGIDDEQED